MYELSPVAPSPFAPRPVPRVLLLVSLFLVVACTSADTSAEDRGEAPRADAPVTTPPSIATDSVGEPPAADPVTDSIVAAILACPRDGKWHPCSLERRLYMAGLRMVPSDSVLRIPGIDREAHAWLAGRQSLRAVFFANEAEAEAAMAGLDSARAAPRGDVTVAWPDRPTLIRTANVVALLLGGSDRQVERVSNALLGGPPQPGTP